ncbi:MAG: PAC2 family protein [Dehalococcoidales bacterium]|nr:PAC2 family protein [Dehalococcoidales bacterium]
MNDRFKVFAEPESKNPSLLVIWNDDISRISGVIGDHLARKLPYQPFADIEPTDFFPLGGVTVEDNVIQFPESRFYSCPGKDLFIFRGDPPTSEWFLYLDLILEAARRFNVQEIYAIGGMISLAAHTNPRQLMAVFNSLAFKTALAEYGLASELDYKTPAGQRPTLNSFLLWATRRRDIRGVNLWVPLPFYLLNASDPSAEKKVLDFFNQRFDLQLDLSDLEMEIRRQNASLAEMRSTFPEINRSLTMLESNLGLSQEENERLVKGVEEFLRGKRTKPGN